MERDNYNDFYRDFFSGVLSFTQHTIEKRTLLMIRVVFVRSFQRIGMNTDEFTKLLLLYPLYHSILELRRVYNNFQRNQVKRKMLKLLCKSILREIWALVLHIHYKKGILASGTFFLLSFHLSNTSLAKKPSKIFHKIVFPNK